VRRALATLSAAALLVTGCGAGDAEMRTPQPRDGQSGLRLTGTLEGRQIAVSDGLPRLHVGDCDPRDGPDQDVCFISRTIDGRLFVFVIENPAVLEAGTTIPVADVPCPSPAACDEVTDAALVDVQLEDGGRQRAIGGSLTIRTLEPATRYVGDVRLDLPRGRLSGTFDIIPRPEE
jgi:hypothetical protein